MAQGLSDEQVARLAEYYISNPSVTLKQVAADSVTLAGVSVSYDTLRQYSHRHRWGVLKRRHQMGKIGLPKSVAEEAGDLREIVYDLMMNPEDKLDIDQLAKAITMWEKLQQVSPQTRSAKTSRQQLVEAAHRGDRKINEFRSSRNGND